MFFLLGFIIFVFLVFVVFYGIWRLEFIYGYENILFIGLFLRDFIIELLFGFVYDML